MDLYKIKKLISKLKLYIEKIDYYINGCMLYYKDDTSLGEYKFYNAPWYKPMPER